MNTEMSVETGIHSLVTTRLRPTLHQSSKISQSLHNRQQEA